MNNQNKKILAPSILSADFAKLGQQVLEATEGGAQLLHIDVMDGHFVPNISFGAPILKSIAKLDIADFDVHLMIENPDRYIDDFVTEKTQYITVHQEACIHLHRTLCHIKEKGAKCGVSINPATPLETLKWVLPMVDLVLVMSVNPGFGGQKFIDFSLDKIQELDKIRKEQGLEFRIQVDGGVTLKNAKELVDCGADILVAGSAVFGTDNIKSTVSEFVHVMNQ